jgi:hypothetical protein
LKRNVCGTLEQVFFLAAARGFEQQRVARTWVSVAYRKFTQENFVEQFGVKLSAARLHLRNCGRSNLGLRRGRCWGCRSGLRSTNGQAKNQKPGRQKA